MDPGPGAMLLITHGSARAFDVVLNAQGEYLDAYLIDGTEPHRAWCHRPDPRARRSEGQAGAGRTPRERQALLLPKGFGPKALRDRRRHYARPASIAPRRRPGAASRAGAARCTSQGPRRLGRVQEERKWAKRVIHVEVEGEFSDDNQPQGTSTRRAALRRTGQSLRHRRGPCRPGSPDGAFLVSSRAGSSATTPTAFSTAGSARPHAHPRRCGQFLRSRAGRSARDEVLAAFPTSAADCANPEHLVTTPPPSRCS